MMSVMVSVCEKIVLPGAAILVVISLESMLTDLVRWLAKGFGEE